ncbi:MAG: hypothetical protein EPN75_01900 [Beijerinckiaceae bacterium]|nr:MAG: hypothetical protein EPN75_01900 [Beijerinckiaceae bacterium]
MAEYYPLLAKAVAGIPNSTPEMRRAVYERARKALLAQLTNLTPPIPESDIARETQSLDEAVARLEAELADSGGKTAAPAPAAPADEPAAKAAAPKISPPLSRPMRPPAPGAGGAAARPVLPARPKAFEAKPFQARPSEPKLSDPRLSEAKPAASSFAGLAKPQASASPQPAPASAAVQDSAAIKTPEPAESKAPDAKEPQDQSVQRAEAEPFSDSFEAMTADAQRSRSEGPRIYVPQAAAADDARTRFRLWVVGGVVALVVAIVAVAAWGLRDRPGEIAKLKPAATAQSKDGGKIVARIGGPKPSEPASAAAPAQPQAPAKPANTAAAGAAPASAAAPTAAAAAPAVKPPSAGQTIAVTHRAALLVAVPNEPTKPKVYVGTVVWRLDNVSAGPGQPLGTAVHAEINVPDDKMKVSLTLARNTDPSLDVSHTITVVFNVQPDSPTGGIKQINAPQLRADDTAYGQSLAGVPVPIMANSFLIGLTRGDSEKTNLDLIKQRAWFDIPILLSNGSIAKLTFEKGVSGTRVIDEAIAAWQGQGQAQGH